MALQSPHALSDDYIDLNDNNQFDVYSLNASCEIFGRNML